jgi:PTH1 family peptidyl-tRNA hydrolase
VAALSRLAREQPSREDAGEEAPLDMPPAPGSKGPATPGRGGGQIKLIMGLGNPGPGYAQTRHNAGFMALSLFAEKNRLETPANFKSSVIINGSVQGNRVILAWPLTYMNLSGVAARELYCYYKIPGTENVIVLHDEMDLPPGRVKVSLGGGTAGHNGVSSIKENLPGEFAHVRIGIGRPPKFDWPDQGGSKDYVLSPFEEDELEFINEGLELAAEATLAWIKGGLGASQRLANKKPKKPKKETPEDAPKETEKKDTDDKEADEKEADEKEDGE